MRQSFDTFITNDPKEIILADSASALWSLQISNMHKVLQSPSGKQVLFMDNYYTRHPFAQKIKQLTNDEIIDDVALFLLILEGSKSINKLVN